MLPKLMQNGKRPSFVFPGGYPIVYSDRENSTLCAECASPVYPINETPSYRLKPVAANIYYEGPTIQCGECGKGIASAYGDLDDSEEG